MSASSGLLPQRVCSVCELRPVVTDTGYFHAAIGKWCCSRGCLQSANAQPNATCFDGGNPADRKRLVVPAPQQTADRPIRCPSCRVTRHWIDPTTSDAALERFLDAAGWTHTVPRICSKTCAESAPGLSKPQVVPPDYELARAAARRRQGLPELPEHRGILPTTTK